MVARWAATALSVGNDKTTSATGVAGGRGAGDSGDMGGSGGGGEGGGGGGVPTAAITAAVPGIVTSKASCATTNIAGVATAVWSPEPVIQACVVLPAPPAQHAGAGCTFAATTTERPGAAGGATAAAATAATREVDRKVLAVVGAMADVDTAVKAPAPVAAPPPKKPTGGSK